jgi:hypothetical protein
MAILDILPHTFIFLIAPIAGFRNIFKVCFVIGIFLAHDHISYFEAFLEIIKGFLIEKTLSAAKIIGTGL